MRISLFSILALASTFTSVFSAPAAEVASLDTRKAAANLTKMDIVTNLTSTIMPFLASINATAKTVTPSSPAADIAVAKAAFSADISGIVSAISYATTQAGTLHKRAIMSRQAAVPLGVTLGQLIAEIVAAVDNLLFSLGLGPASGLLAPLGPALSQLLLALELVVNDLLAAVQTLVDDLLTGLATGLA